TGKAAAEDEGVVAEGVVAGFAVVPHPASSSAAASTHPAVVRLPIARSVLAGQGGAQPLLLLAPAGHRLVDLADHLQPPLAQQDELERERGHQRDHQLDPEVHRYGYQDQRARQEQAEPAQRVPQRRTHAQTCCGSARRCASGTGASYSRTTWYRVFRSTGRKPASQIRWSR